MLKLLFSLRFQLLLYFTSGARGNGTIRHTGMWTVSFCLSFYRRVSRTSYKGGSLLQSVTFSWNQWRLYLYFISLDFPCETSVSRLCRTDLWKIAVNFPSYICRMDKKHKYGRFYYGKIRKFNKKAQTKIHLALGNCTRNGVRWIHTWGSHGSLQEKLYKPLQKLVMQRCRILQYKFNRILMSKVIVF